MIKSAKKVICYISASSGDWGGASRVLFTNIRLIDRDRYQPIVLLPSEGPILPLLQQIGVPYYLWGGQGHHEPDGVVQYTRHILSAMRFFRRERVDVVHINHANYWRPAEIVAAKLLRLPIITHYHVLIKKPGPFVRFSNLIIAVSEYAARYSQPAKVPKAVIYNSVALERFDKAHDMRAELGISANDVVVAFIGQIRTIKGIDLFIKMCRAIPGKSVKFLIVGECRDPKKYVGFYSNEQLLAEISADTRIRYVGYRSDVQNLYRTSDIVVMPSRCGEAFGLINIEAGAAGKPMVSTRDGGIPEIINHEENGFLVEREDLEGLIHHTKLLIDNPALRLSMGRTARQVVEQKFTSLPVRKLEQAYDALIEPRTGRQ